jgi:hypothetical protein
VIRAIATDLCELSPLVISSDLFHGLPTRYRTSKAGFFTALNYVSMHGCLPFEVSWKGKPSGSLEIQNMQIRCHTND